MAPNNDLAFPSELSNGEISSIPQLAPELVDIGGATSLADDVGLRIESLIFDGKYKPGEQLKETELSELLEVSRSTVRESLRKIESRGLINVVPNRGAFVKTLTLQEEIEIFDLRAELSRYAVRILTMNLSSEMERQLKEILNLMERAIDQDGMTYYRHNIKFHDLILMASGNSRAIEFHRRLVRESYLNRRKISLMTKAGMLRSNSEHKLLVDAICAGDVPLAEQLAYQHVIDGKLRLIGNYRG